MKTDYDEAAPFYDGRFQRYEYAGTAETLRAFMGASPARALELGCGTGHWIAMLRGDGHSAIGVDPSRGMLHEAAAKLPPELFALARAEHLPFADASFDRVVSINAVHHYGDPQRALHEARRVLTPGGAVLVIALDPSAGVDEWYVYDYFAGTRAQDLARYPSTAALQRWMQAAGFEQCESIVAEPIHQERPARQALAEGAIGKHVTSQLSNLSDEAYRAGIAAIEAAAAAAEARGEQLILRARLKLFATLGVVPAAAFT
jgi:ubiquinone/menaquinone biosynthesis C-methylase UbiE